MVALPLAPIRAVVCASPGYLARYAASVSGADKGAVVS